ncbi:MAG TPA: hypothetical protein VG895_05370 [Patescibacteria group bacterium]|nr:hypothetical protein [Patescibacteria group bacterium]
MQQDQNNGGQMPGQQPTMPADPNAPVMPPTPEPTQPATPAPAPEGQPTGMPGEMPKPEGQGDSGVNMPPANGGQTM